MQQHHYSLTQPRTCLPHCIALYLPSDSHLSLFFFEFFPLPPSVLFLIYYLTLLSFTSPHIIHPPFSSLPIPRIFRLQSWQNWVSISHPLCVSADPPRLFFCFFSLSLLFDTASHRSAYATVPGTRIEQPTEYNKWTYMGG